MDQRQQASQHRRGKRLAVADDAAPQVSGTAGLRDAPRARVVDELPQHHEHDQGHWQAEREAALRDDERGERVAEAEWPLADQRVVLRQVADQADQTLFPDPSLVEQQQPAKATAEQDDQRRNERGEPVARQHCGEPLQEAHQRKPQDQVLDEERLAHRRAELDELGRHHVRDVRI